MHAFWRVSTIPVTVDTRPIWHVSLGTRVKLYGRPKWTRVFNTRVQFDTCIPIHVSKKIWHVYWNTRVKLCSLWHAHLTRVLRVSNCTCLTVWHVYDTVHVSKCTCQNACIFVVINLLEFIYWHLTNTP